MARKRILVVFPKEWELAREMKWLGSYRYAVVNLGGTTEEDLEQRYAEIRRLLGFDEAATAS